MNLVDRTKNQYKSRQTSCFDSNNNLVLPSTNNINTVFDRLNCNNTSRNMVRPKFTNVNRVSESMKNNNKSHTLGKINNNPPRQHFKTHFNQPVPNRNTVLPFNHPLNYNSGPYRPRVDRSNNVRIINPIIIINSGPEEDKKYRRRNRPNKKLDNNVNQNNTGVIIEDLGEVESQPGENKE
jgi:hypothetical protein